MAKVLLIEPDIILAKTTAESLVANGHTVAICHQAATALEHLELKKPDVIVLELQLADHGGIEFLYEIRSYPEWQSIPIIVQSLTPGNLFSNNTKQIQNMGITQYLYKPTTRLRQLNQAVNAAVEHVGV